MITSDIISLVGIGAGFVTPVVLAILGYKLNNRLKSIENSQWHSRTIISKRLEIYDEIAPDLNALYCFFRFVGYWKELSPQDVLDKKRDLDKSINIYRHLLSNEFYESYNIFIHTGFRTFTGLGKDALIRSEISNSWGDRSEHTNYYWQTEWASYFDESNIPSASDFDRPYQDVMAKLKNCIGLNLD